MPQLAMHSIREMCGVDDVAYAHTHFLAFFRCGAVWGWGACVCVCACVRACVRVCVCVRACACVVGAQLERAVGMRVVDDLCDPDPPTCPAP